ncbi:MAG: hypothetical protein VCD00_12530 [Candidatus Hydrogenedentota bacterium]
MPTHFSQFTPLLTELWGEECYKTGCISSHYQNMVVEGEEVKAFVEIPKDGETSVRIRAEKKDGTPVLMGTASVGSDHSPSELEARMERLRPAGDLIVLRDMNVGDKGAEDERVSMDFDQHLGKSYPFTLNSKLKVITEDSPWHYAGNDSPWGSPIIPLEMVCVLCQFSSRQKGWNIRQPHIGLFADLEIGMVQGPLFVGKEYRLDRELIALGQTRRTEGYWVRTLIRDGETDEVVAYSLLHQAVMKDSFPTYEEELAALK